MDMEAGVYNYNLRCVTQPIGEPVTVEEAKEWAHIDHDVEDDTILLWIKSAREAAEIYQGRAYFYQTWEVSFDKPPAMPFFFPRAPIISVDSVKYYDTANVEYTRDLSYFYIDLYSIPGRIAHGYTYTWPGITYRAIRAVVMTFTCGYSDDVPAYVKEAILLYCSFRNQNRTSEIDKIPDAFYHLLVKEKMW